MEGLNRYTAVKDFFFPIINRKKMASKKFSWTIQLPKVWNSLKQYLLGHTKGPHSTLMTCFDSEIQVVNSLTNCLLDAGIPLVVVFAVAESGSRSFYIRSWIPVWWVVPSRLLVGSVSLSRFLYIIPILINRKKKSRNNFWREESW